MSRHILDRRTFLRGLGGAAIGLPLLEAMVGNERSHAAPTTVPRYLVCYTGVSLGGGGDALHNDLVPNTLGAGYDIKSAIAPFGKLSVASEIAIVSGLQVPWAGQNGGTVPPGGRTDNFHGTSVLPQLNGMRSTMSGATSDAIVADAFAAGGKANPFHLRVQPIDYRGGGGNGMSIRKDAAGKLISNEPTVSPQQAFKNLFGTYVPPVDTSGEIAYQLRKRKSVLDLVRDDNQRLVAKLGGADRARLERHLDEIRLLEKRIAAIPPVVTGSCKVPAAPPTDPKIGGDFDTGAFYDVNNGYSGEKERARVLCDLTHMAFTCDISRVGTLMFTLRKCYLNMLPLTGQASDLHEITHYALPGAQTKNVSAAIAWFTEQFAYLVDKMRATTEAGGNLLTNSAIVMLFEGGHGDDPEGSAKNSPHSTQNMVAIVAGRAGGLKAGHHVAAPGKHPANVLVSAMNAVGVSTPALGEVSGEISGLRT